MNSRRSFLSQAWASGAVAGLGFGPAHAAQEHPDAQWYAAALAMLRLAETWGDQPYGAVLVMKGAVAGEGPSRVVKDQNPDAHAERVAILDAQRRLGRQNLAGSVLYSTSRPCALCEAAAHRAGVSRMYHGPALRDAGAPASSAARPQ